MIHLYHTYYVSIIFDVLTAGLTVVIPNEISYQKYIHVGITAVHEIFCKAVQAVLMFKLFKIRVGDKMHFSKPVLTYIFIMTAQIIFVFVRIIVYFLEESESQNLVCAIMAIVDFVVSLGLSPFMMYAAMQIFLSIAIQKEEKVKA